MSKNKKIALITIAAVIVITIILAGVSMLGKNPVSNALNTVFSPIQSGVNSITKPIGNFFGYIFEIGDLKEENARLKSELETLKKESRNQEEYKKENTRLKKLLNLTDEITTSETVVAKIVAYEPENWFYKITINKGENHGISLSDTVISEKGLVGKVCEVGSNWAKISTLLDTGNAIGVKLARTGDFGIAEGDVNLLKKRRLNLNYLSKESSLVKGDLLETSGLGGVYPAGISVGTIEEIEFDNTGELLKAVIAPSVNLEEIYEVLVITSWENVEYSEAQGVEE